MGTGRTVTNIFGMVMERVSQKNISAYEVE